MPILVEKLNQLLLVNTTSHLSSKEHSHGNECSYSCKGKGKAAKVDHVVQDLEVRFNAGDKVFLAGENAFAEVREVYDEEWLEKHENGYQKYIETYPFKPDRRGMHGLYHEPTEGIHYEIYWMLEGEALPTRAKTVLAST